MLDEFTLESLLLAGVLCALSFVTRELSFSGNLLTLLLLTLELFPAGLLSFATLEPPLCAGVLLTLSFESLELLKSAGAFVAELAFIVLWWSLILLCSGCLSLKLP